MCDILTCAVHEPAHEPRAQSAKEYKIIKYTYKKYNFFRVCKHTLLFYVYVASNVLKMHQNENTLNLS